MINYKIIISSSFEKELQNIFYYINFFLREHTTAKYFYNKVINSISTLSYFPERFPKLSNNKNSNFRRLLIDNYIIIYEVNNTLEQVHILHIFHNTQNYLNLL